MIREDNVTLQTLQEDLMRDKIALKEYVTRSEGTQLFTTAINKHLLTMYKSVPTSYQKVFMTIQKGDGEGRTVSFPSMNGVNPQYVPELSEVPFSNMDITATTVQADKHGLRMGVSQEMIDDNEVSLITWLVGMVGQKMAVEVDEECFKALDTWFSTGAALANGIVTSKGRTNRGAFYTTGTLTYGCTHSGTATWEEIITTALGVMRNATITLNGITYRTPMFPNTIITNSLRDLPLRRLLASAGQVYATGMSPSTLSSGATTLLSNGANPFNGLLNIVANPYTHRGIAYITEAGRGLVLLMREPIRVERQANWAFEAEEVKAITRFCPAVVEERSVFGITLNTA